MIFDETQQSVSKWARETFGSHATLGIATRANVELAELLSCFSNQADLSAVADEIADVQIILWQVAQAVGPELKMHDLRFKFGIHQRDPYRTALSLNRTMAKLMVSLRSLEDGTGGRGVVWHLFKAQVELKTLALILGLDLQALVNVKMQTNRNREWTTNEHGRFQHV